MRPSPTSGSNSSGKPGRGSPSHPRRGGYRQPRQDALGCHTPDTYPQPPGPHPSSSYEHCRKSAAHTRSKQHRNRIARSAPTQRRAPARRVTTVGPDLEARRQGAARHARWAYAAAALLICGCDSPSRRTAGSPSASQNVTWKYQGPVPGGIRITYLEQSCFPYRTTSRQTRLFVRVTVTATPSQRLCSGLFTTSATAQLAAPFRRPLDYG